MAAPTKLLAYIPLGKSSPVYEYGLLAANDAAQTTSFNNAKATFNGNYALLTTTKVTAQKVSWARLYTPYPNGVTAFTTPNAADADNEFGFASGAPPVVKATMIFTNGVRSGDIAGQYSALANTQSSTSGTSPDLPSGTVTLLPVPGTFSALAISLNSNATGTATTGTLYKNGIATAVTLSIPTGTLFGTTGLSVHGVAGDLFSLLFNTDTNVGSLASAIAFTPD